MLPTILLQCNDTINRSTFMCVQFFFFFFSFFARTKTIPSFMQFTLFHMPKIRFISKTEIFSRKQTNLFEKKGFTSLLCYTSERVIIYAKLQAKKTKQFKQKNSK